VVTRLVARRGETKHITAERAPSRRSSIRCDRESRLLPAPRARDRRLADGPGDERAAGGARQIIGGVGGRAAPPARALGFPDGGRVAGAEVSGVRRSWRLSRPSNGARRRVETPTIAPRPRSSASPTSTHEPRASEPPPPRSPRGRCRRAAHAHDDHRRPWARPRAAPRRLAAARSPSSSVGPAAL
jgi:hypothetical protein